MTYPYLHLEFLNIHVNNNKLYDSQGNFKELRWFFQFSVFI